MKPFTNEAAIPASKAQPDAGQQRRVTRQAAQAKINRFLWIIRAAEWWEYKTPLALGTAYALAWRQHVPFRAMVVPTLLLLGASVTGGIYASLINDLMDREEDSMAGKTTGIMTLTAIQRRFALVGSLLSALAMALLLSRYPLSMVCYLIVAVLMSLYSVPPIRLKMRGAWGVLCIGLGENLLPMLLAVLLVVEGTGCSLPPVWIFSALLWSLALGCRGILWHQLCDRNNDRAVGGQTLGATQTAATIRYLGERIVFPLEIGAFALLLALSPNPLVWKLLAAYIVLEWLRYRYMAANIVIVAPQHNFRFAMLEFYQLFYPLAYLLAAAQRDRTAIGLAAGQLLLFPGLAWLLLTHIRHLLRWRLWPFLITREQLPEQPS